MFITNICFAQQKHGTISIPKKDSSDFQVFQLVEVIPQFLGENDASIQFFIKKLNKSVSFLSFVVI